MSYIALRRRKVINPRWMAAVRVVLRENEELDTGVEERIFLARSSFVERSWQGLSILPLCTKTNERVVSCIREKLFKSDS